jgi:tetratricopeptide (TPR) repeat protein
LDFSKHLQKADQALERRNYDYAIELYRQLIDLDPDLGEARSGLRRALRGKHERAGSGRVRRLVSGALPLGRAKALRRMGKLDAAARALEDYLLVAPLDEEANLALGEVLEEAGHARSARAVYEFLAEIAPRNPEGLKRAGAMMRQAGDVARALSYYEQVLRIDPRDRDALKARKDLAAETALTRGTAPEVRHSRDLARDPAELARLERSRRAHLSDADLEGERARLEAALAAAPQDAESEATLSDVCRKLGRLEDALAHAQAAARLAPDSIAHWQRVGELGSKLLERRMARADELGDTDGAAALERELRAHEVADWKKRVALRPNDPELVVGLARRHVRAGEVDAAIALLQRVQRDPRVRGEALFLLARSFREKGFLDLSEKNLRAALDEAAHGSERSKDILYELGLLAEGRGEREQARSFFVRIFEIDIGYRDVADKLKEL